MNLLTIKNKTIMKTLPQKIVEVDNEGLISLLGEMVLIFCFNYFYYGKLEGVNESCIKLSGVYQVFETGAFNDSKFKDAQKFADEWYIQNSAIESFGKSFKATL
jgi:hypothetical protein